MDDLLNSFPKANKEKWIASAKKELDGKDPMETLRWVVDAEIQAYPYYDRNDLSKSGYATGLKPSSNDYLGPRGWYNMPAILVGKPEEANTQAIEALQSGADGIVFDLTGQTAVPMEVLLEGIEWQYCPIGLIISTENGLSIAQSLKQFVDIQNLPQNSLEGFITWDGFPSDASAISQLFEGFSKFRSLTLRVGSQNVTNELSGAIATTVSFLQSINDRDLQHSARQLGFSIELDQHFFSGLAKLKAFRILWTKVLESFEVKSEPFIHAVSSRWVNESFEPHGNMIKSTSTALAAICGGCDALTIEPADPEDRMVSRVARNVSNILREESFLDKVADPTAGSYFLESLIRDIVERSWAEFLSKVESNEA